MEAQDLRIGNFVKQPSRLGKVSEIWQEAVILEGYNNAYDYENTKPIPLTEDWLIKFGFKRSGDMVLLLPMLHIKSEIHFEKHAYGNVITLQNSLGTFIPDDIDYVHQLQNLYFAISGKELEFNEKL